MTLVVWPVNGAGMPGAWCAMSQAGNTGAKILKPSSAGNFSVERA